MPLSLPAGRSCFIDASCLYYCFVGPSPMTAHCVDLLRRVRSGEISVICTTGVLVDMLHKVMCAEVVARFSRPRAGLLSWLKDHPECIGRLEQHHAALTVLGESGVRVIPMTQELAVAAVQVGREEKLLMGDALIVAAMRREGLMDLVTNDDDFDRVARLRVWKPRP